MKAYVPPIARVFGAHEFRTRAQLVAAGVTANRIARAVRAGLLVEHHHNLYRLGTRPISPAGALRAALVAAGPGAVASHRSAAHAWGLVAEPGPLPVLSVPADRRPRLTAAIVHRPKDLAKAHVVVWHGTPVTDPLRTAVDVAATEPRQVLDELIDTGLRRRTFTVEGLAAEAVRRSCHGRPGTRALRAALAERGFTGAPRPTELEARARRLLGQHAIEVTGVEVVVLAGRYRVDMTLRPPVVVELLGYRWHWSPEAMAADLARANALVCAGLRVLQFSWADVVAEPQRAVATVRRALSPS